jgi:hypothetical protein
VEACLLPFSAGFCGSPVSSCSGGSAPGTRPAFAATAIPELGQLRPSVVQRLLPSALLQPRFKDGGPRSYADVAADLVDLTKIGEAAV